MSEHNPSFPAEFKDDYCRECKGTGRVMVRGAASLEAMDPGIGAPTEIACIACKLTKEAPAIQNYYVQWREDYDDHSGWFTEADARTLCERITKAEREGDEGEPTVYVVIKGLLTMPEFYT